MEVSDYIRPNLSPNLIHARLRHFCLCISNVLNRLFNVKIPPEIFHRELVLTVGFLNKLSELLSKIITLECGNGTLIHRFGKRCGAGRQEHHMNDLIDIRKAWGLSRSIVQEEENFEGHLPSLTVSLQFMMKFSGKKRFKQAYCNPSFLIRPPYNRQTLLRITLECSKVF
jgi:hypothetical protein